MQASSAQQVCAQPHPDTHVGLPHCLLAEYSVQLNRIARDTSFENVKPCAMQSHTARMERCAFRTYLPRAGSHGSCALATVGLKPLSEQIGVVQHPGAWDKPKIWSGSARHQHRVTCFIPGELHKDCSFLRLTVASDYTAFSVKMGNRATSNLLNF